MAGFYCQPQSPLGLIGVETGLGLGWDCVWGDLGRRGWGRGLGLDNFLKFGTFFEDILDMSYSQPIRGKH